MTPLVSIVIPTKNAGQTLEACLESIRRQTYQDIEFIVVDNRSTDNTTGIAKEYTNKVLSKGPERSVQRNFGVQKSSGKYVAWFDADMILEPKVIEECVKAVEKNNKLKAVIIPEASIGEGFWAACRALEKRCYLGDEKIEAVRFAEKKAFTAVGRLSPSFVSGEDWDITTRLRNKGYQIGRIKSFVLHNEGNLSLLENLRKKYYYATKSLPYVKRHITGPRDVFFFIFRPAYFRNWRLLLRDPIHTLGIFFMKTMEFSVGLLGIINEKRRLSN